MCVASNLEQPKEKQCVCFPRAFILDPSYTYVNKGSPPSLVFFRNHHFQDAARWARGPVRKGPARRILKMMISEVATEGHTIPILYLCKQASPPSLVFFEMNIFKMRRAGPRAHVLKGPTRPILKLFIS